MKRRKTNSSSKVKLPLHVYLVYLLVCTFLLTGVSFSRYIADAGGGDDAWVAAGGISVTGSGNKTISLDCNTMGNPQSTYDFTVTNRDGGKTSEVAVEYDIVVSLTSALPSGVTMTLDGSSGSVSSNGKTYTFSGGTFAAMTSGSESHTLTIAADADNVTGSSPHTSNITISVLAEQID